MENTSVSDNGWYPEICYLASKHDDLFQNFKIHPVYCQIIPGSLDRYHVGLGAEFLKIILENKKFNFRKYLGGGGA